MSQVGQRERLTQQQVLRFFQDELGYRYLGDWRDRAGNRNVEEDLLREWLVSQGYDEKLRYGVKVRPSVDEQTVTVWLIDWENPDNNDFAVAEEVTVAGVNTKRPDIVLYVNGLALGVLELKRSIVAVSEGIH